MGSSLINKVVIITGAAGGLGAAQARACAAEGARLVLTDKDESGVRSLAISLGQQARAIAHDVTSETGWQEVARLALNEFDAIDVLVNNAGIHNNATVETVTLTTMQQVYAVNALGPLLGMQAVVPIMKARQGGSIVNIISAAAMGGKPGIIAYCASKWAMRGISRSAALDLAPYGIRVNAIFPGIIETAMTRDDPQITAIGRNKLPIGRIGQPDDIAPFVVLLASDSSSFVTGAEYLVDGGRGI